MSKDEIFSVWSPDASPWSLWVKPVLFAHLDSPISHAPLTQPPPDVDWAPPVEQNVALVLDLPGAEGAVAGVALAALGYRPIPLYNALPLPFDRPFIDPASGEPDFGGDVWLARKMNFEAQSHALDGLASAVDVWPILASLRHGAKQLACLNLPDDAPPAFLLDSNRQGNRHPIREGEFDNRSISFATDFPSANFLASRGIQRALLVQKVNLQPQSDLAHTLRRWQEGAIKLESLTLSPLSPPSPLDVPKPTWYRSMFQRAFAALGLRPRLAGGFGAWLPDTSTTG